MSAVPVLGTTPAGHATKNIDATRTRGACSECRRRRRKCDLGKPSCRRCVATRSTCAYASGALEFRDATAWAAQKVKSAKAKVRASHAAVVRDGSASGSTSGKSGKKTAKIASPLHFVSLSPPLSAPMDLTPALSPGPTAAPMAVEDARAAVSQSDLLSEFGVVNQREQTDFDDFIWPVHPDDPPFQTSESPFGESDVTTGNSASVHGSSALSISVTEGIQLPDQDYSVTESQSMLPVPLHTIDNESRDQGTPTDSHMMSPVSHSWQAAVPEQMLPDSGGQSQFRTKCDWRLQFPSPPRSLHSAPDVPVADRLYLANFATHVLNLLPTEVRSLHATAMAEPPVRLAAMAHSAAHLAHLQGALETGQSHTPKWIPRVSHSKRASELASQAWHAISSSMDLSLGTRLAVALFLCYYELEAGTFQGLWSLVYHLDMLIVASLNEISGLAHGVMQGWSHIRALAKRTKPLIRPTGPESRLERVLSGLEEDYAMSRRADAISVVAMRLNGRAFLCKCLGHSGFSSRESLHNIKLWWRILQGTADTSKGHLFEDNFDTILEEDQVYAELQCLADRLQGCDVPQEFPVNFEAILDQSATGSETNLNVSDSLFKFSSHDQAMACADYAFAHITSDHRLLRWATAPAGQRRAQSHRPLQANPWLALLQQIALSLDVAECARRNTYRMAIITQLLCSALLCAEPAVLDFLDELVHCMLVQGSRREDAMTPLLPVSQIIKTLRQEFSQGRQVFLCSVTFNEWTSKEDLFSSAEGECLIVLGRDANGTLFNDCVPLVQGNCDDFGQ